MYIQSLVLSDKKKYKITFSDNSEVHFGYSDYESKLIYKQNEDFKSPNILAKYLLFGDSNNLSTNYKTFKRRFNL